MTRATDWGADFSTTLIWCVDSSVNTQSLPLCVHKLFASHVVASQIATHVKCAAQYSQNESPGEARATLAQPAKTANTSAKIDTVARLPRVCIVVVVFVVVVAGSLPRARRSVASPVAATDRIALERLPSRKRESRLVVGFIGFRVTACLAWLPTNERLGV